MIFVWVNIGQKYLNGYILVKNEDIKLLSAGAVANVQLPYTTMKGTWKKAASLVAELNAIVPAPGLGPKEKMVKSKSGTTSHLISVNGVKYECDNTL